MRVAKALVPGLRCARRPVDSEATFPQLSFHRGRLQGVLLRAVRERLRPGTVRPGHRLVGYDQDAHGVEARFVDRRGAALDPARGDVLIGADGIHSTVRAIMYPDRACRAGTV